MTRLLVIGSNSFSGAHFVDYALQRGYPVLGISRSRIVKAPFWPLSWNEGKDVAGARFRFVQADLNEELPVIKDEIKRFRPSHIVNFAALGMVAESWLYPTDYFRTNLLSQVALHDYLRRMPFLKKYLHVGTPEVYGHTDGLVDESADFRPSTPYAASRAACDLHLKTFLNEYRFPVVWTRSANVFGPGQQAYRIVPRTMLSIRLGQRLPLHGGGMSARSFIHIRDVCNATLEIALKAEPGKCYHIATQRTIKISDLVITICEIAGADFKELVEIVPERRGKDNAYLLNSNQLRRELGWRDRIGLMEGLTETLTWVDRYLPDLAHMPLDYHHKP
jgi:dTDP-glucose 4,6-dehydratase